MSLVLALLASLTGTAHASELTDPTRPASVPMTVEAVATASYELRLVRIGEHDRTALVNQTLVRVGDRVDGAVVRAIEPGEVMLASDQRIVRLTLGRAAVKRLAGTALGGLKP